MYSVEDLLISHGYKVSSSNNAPPSRSPSAHEQQPPARSNSRCEIVDKRTGHGTANGYKADCVYSAVRQTSSRAGPTDSESRDRSQRTEEVDNSNPGDGHSPGDTVTSDRGFHDGHRGMSSQPRPERDVSYWRRQGQDFNTLLDYADFRDPQGKAAGVPLKAEGMQRRPESALSAEEHRRERQRRADSARARERELALYQWRMAAERKYQSLGTEEWRPAVGISRHASESEGERWAQEQHRPRTAEGAVPSRTKAKSQSLPRMVMPSDSMQYLSLTPSGQDPCGSYRLNGHQSRVPHGRNVHEGEGRDRRIDNARSGMQSAPPLKPRFSRPLRPPSYEVHQQMRGSSEMLSGEFVPHSRDRTPLPFTRQDYFAQDPGGSGMDPPGYIPPPSYRRQPAVRGGQRTYANSMGNYQYRGDPYIQGPAMAEVQEWFLRQTGMAWPDNYRDGRRSMPCRIQAYPAYSEERLRNVQYIPFDDPRVRHISGEGMDGNSLTDADKIRNIRKEVPVTSSEKCPGDSAFLLSGKQFSSTEASKSNISDCANEAVIPKDVSGEVVSTKTITDENSNRYPASHDYSNTFQTTSSQLKTPDQAFSETVTQVKTFEAQTAAKNKKNKKKIKETMFCLVSVPINTATSKEAADPNNNDKIPSLVMAPTENAVTKPCGKDIVKSDNINEQYVPSSSSSTARNPKRAPLRKEIVDVWSLQANADKELCYAGSWPGEQYKNQETQTGSPVASRNTNPQISHSQAMYDPPSSDSGIGTECNANYRYPTKVQKDISSNSTSQSQSRKISGSNVTGPTQVLTAPPLPSPHRQNPVRRTEPKPHAPDGQEVFGQFLLKPVNRRPWDAIGELESFNKELQDVNSKQQNIDQSIEDLDEALKSILEISNTNAEYSRPVSAPNKLNKLMQGKERGPGRELRNDLVVRSDLEYRIATEAGEDFREGRSAFSRPKGRFENLNIAQRQEIPVSDFVSYEVLHTIRDDPRENRLDIPVAKESLLKDVGLTVYTAIPDTVTSGSPVGLSPESPMLTSPSDISESCEPLHITSSDSGGDQSVNSPDFSMDHQTSNSPDHKNKRITNSQRSPPIHGAKRQIFRYKTNHNADSYDDDLYSDYLSWSNEKTVADEHLEALLSQEKANNLPSEDLSNLYQIQCAQGIPVHESIEQRAARILGIAVPVEALVLGQDDGEPGEESGKGGTKENKEEAAFVIQTNKEKQHVIRGTEEVTETSVHSHELMEMKDIGESIDSREDKPGEETHTVFVALELPEFPPTNLRLSLPVAEDEDLTLSVRGGDKKVMLTSDVSGEPPEELIAYHPSSVCENEETSAQHINPELVDESMSGINGFRKEIYNIKDAEEREEDRIENRVQEDKVLEEKEQFVENDLRAREEDAAARQKIDEDDDGRSDDEEQEPKDETEQPPKLMTLSVPVPQPRNGTVAKREITLPETFTNSDSAEDDDIQSGSDTYDPSRVERV